ncbi:hypothetical protein [Pararobbsia alpina]|uniref:Uncharacterized protein n=1 Tax=Pararobbsia alpina TaxID=621374 RepID=A0A6S7BGR8_9BURK|nr:hypothetical protein [Pararobbsia alpina]CAB3799790.1 hypothetical protein LMG28138_04725 [Pararobbsia alpina]
MDSYNHAVAGETLATASAPPSVFAERRTDRPRSLVLSRLRRSPTGGDGGGNGGGTETRIGKLGASVEHVQQDVSDLRQDVREIRSLMATDFRLTWAGLIAVALGLAGMMAKGFHWL